MNSDRDLIEDILTLKVFAPGQPLAGKLTLLEPDMDYPLALNLFAMGKDRLDAYGKNQREQLINGTVELFRYMFDGLSDSGMTDKQVALFKPTIRALLQFPQANILTLRDLLLFESGRPEQKRARLAELPLQHLDPESRAFMEGMFFEYTFNTTRQELGWRLHGLLDARGFTQMFSAPECKLDLYTELNAGRVILIHTNKALLEEPQAELFGRFFIAMILRAAQERAALKRNERMATYLYIDECQDYIRRDTKITTILDQCRKMRIATTLANQKLSHLSAPVANAVLEVAIKMANADGEAEQLAGRMRAEPHFLNRPTGSFALHITDVTPQAVALDVPGRLLDDQPKMSRAEEEEVQRHIRMRYSYNPDARNVIAMPRRPAPTRFEDDDVDMQPTRA
jgi:hypothetical protein